MSRGSSDEKWVRAQVKAFTHWVNVALSKRSIRIETLQDGFHNGLNLIALAEILTTKALTQKFSAKPALRVHKITNCVLALDHFKNPDVAGLKNLTISAENIVDGDLTMLLGFCWTLLRRFQDLGDHGKGGKANSYEQGLFEWVKTTLSGSQYSDIHGLLGDGFRSEGFKNGKVFLGLLNELCPKTIDYSSYSVNNHLENCKTALSLAETKGDVPAIIDPDDLASGAASEKELVLYLSLWYNMFKEKQISVSGEALNKKVEDLDTTLRILSEENEALRLANQALQLKTTEDADRLYKLKLAQEELERRLSEEMATQLRETEEKLKQDKEEKLREISRLTESVRIGGDSSHEQTALLQKNLSEVDEERNRLTEELAAFKAAIGKEKDELDKKNAALQKSIAQLNKEREALEAKFQAKMATEGKNLFHLRKDMLSHLGDMNSWKTFLNQQGVRYESEDLHLSMESEMFALEQAKMVQSMAAYVSEEDAKLVGLWKTHQEKLANKDKLAASDAGKKSKTPTSPKGSSKTKGK